MNARFWISVHGHWVKLTLRPGQSRSWSSAGPTDEGYSSTALHFHFDGSSVFQQYADEGRDCDGKHGSYRDRVCRLSALCDNDPARRFDDSEPRRTTKSAARQALSELSFLDRYRVRTPEWEDAGSCAYDQYAELLNY